MNRSVRILNNFFFQWHRKLHSLPPIYLEKITLTYDSIHSFDHKQRSKNDRNNKIRETIITSILNNEIIDEYYTYSPRWKHLKNELDLFVKRLSELHNLNTPSVRCHLAGGRTHHYDFKLLLDDREFFIEFKYNAKCVKDTPQFVSPMKPSQYLEQSYEEFYYNTCVVLWTEKYNLPLPPKDIYLSQIHTPKPPCMREHQEKYYRGCERSSQYSGKYEDISFYETMKQVSKLSISLFISRVDLKKEALTEYLLRTQKNKYYMLYKDGNIHLDQVDEGNYTIVDVVKEPERNRYIAMTKNNHQIKILLRWKNGNGIAFPSFQIS